MKSIGTSILIFVCATMYVSLTFPASIPKAGNGGAAMYGAILAQYGMRRVLSALHAGRQLRVPVALELDSNIKEQQTIMLHAHGLGDCAHNYRLKQLTGGGAEHVEHVILDFKDEERKLGIADGHRDRAVFLEAARSILRGQGSNTHIILKGMGRGGDVVTALDGMYSIPGHVGTIAESAPADVGDVIDHLEDTFANISTVTPAVRTMLEALRLWYHKSSGVQPIDVVHKGKTPLLCITSLEDERIPPRSTVQLYLQAVTSGREAYLKILPHGRHAHLAHSYISEQNAFIAHCTGKAAPTDKALLQRLKPTLQELQQQGLVR